MHNVNLHEAFINPAVFSGHTATVKSVAFFPNRDWVVSGGDTTVRVWDSSNGKVVLSSLCVVQMLAPLGLCLLRRIKPGDVSGGGAQWRVLSQRR